MSNSQDLGWDCASRRGGKLRYMSFLFSRIPSEASACLLLHLLVAISVMYVRVCG